MPHKDPEQRKAYQKAYNLAHPEKLREIRKKAHRKWRKSESGKAKLAEYNEANKKKRNQYHRDRGSNWKRVYKGTEDQWLKYRNATHCECCGIEFQADSKHGKCQDHDHATGELRGVICCACNVAEGMIRDLAHLEALKSYIERR
jgi:hypothetical protein